MPTDEELQERFDGWMDGMDILLEEFMLDLPKEVSAQLDYSVESLDVVENWLLEKYATVDELMSDPDIAPFDASSRYAGQVMARALDGEWAMDINGGPPAIAHKGYWLSPMILVRQAVAKRTGTFLRTITNNYIENNKTLNES